MTTDILWFSELGLKDLDRVGGKNASLGEMVQNLTSAGVQVPDGFATTADAYRRFLGRLRPGPEDRRPAGRPGHRRRDGPGRGRPGDPDR